MKRIAVIGAILDNPQTNQKIFNEVLSGFRGIVKGRMGIPFEKENVAVISFVVQGELDEINTLTGRLGRIENVSVKTTISGKIESVED